MIIFLCGGGPQVDIGRGAVISLSNGNYSLGMGNAILMIGYGYKNWQLTPDTGRKGKDNFRLYIPAGADIPQAAYLAFAALENYSNTEILSSTISMVGNC
jgi:hypothetical protein